MFALALKIFFFTENQAKEVPDNTTHYKRTCSLFPFVFVPSVEANDVFLFLFLFLLFLLSRARACGHEAFRTEQSSE